MNQNTEENFDCDLLTMTARLMYSTEYYFGKRRPEFVADLIHHARFYRPEYHSKEAKKAFLLYDKHETFELEKGFQWAIQRRILDPLLHDYPKIQQAPKDDLDARIDHCLYSEDDSQQKKFSVLVKIKQPGRLFPEDEPFSHRIPREICEALDYVNILFQQEKSSATQEFVSNSLLQAHLDVGPYSST